MPAHAAASGGRWTAALLLSAFIPALTYYPAFAIAGTFVTPRAFLPQGITNQIMVWAVINALITLALMPFAPKRASRAGIIGPSILIALLTVIAGYAALLRPEAVGLTVMAFSNVSLERHSEDLVQGFEQAVTARPEILDCWSVTGEADFVLRIVAADLKSFADFLSLRVLRIPGVRAVRSSIVLHRIKQSTALPLDHVGG